MSRVDLAAIPVIRDTITHEYADGDLVVRLKIAADDVDDFWKFFPDQPEAVFLSNGDGAIEAIRGPLMREYKDGGLAVKLLIGPQHKRQFRMLWPKPGQQAVLVRESADSARQRLLDGAAAANPPAPYGELARQLRTHAPFMLARKVWEAIGTDEQYLEWVRLQKCAKCKWTPHWEGDAYLSSEAAHVRRIASGAGTAIKPAFSAIPLCPTRGDVEGCHAAQHRAGESFLGGKEHVDKLRIVHVQQWAWEALKARLGYEHWNTVPPDTLVAWAREHGLIETLPDSYINAGQSR